MELITILVLCLVGWIVSLWYWPAATITAFLLIACVAGYYAWGSKR